MAAVPVIASIEQVGQGPLPYMIVPVMDGQFAEPCVMYQPYGEYGDVWCSPYQYSGWYDSSNGSRSPVRNKRTSRNSASGATSGAGGRGSYGYPESPKTKALTDQDVSVVLSGLPKMLCSEACLKAMFEQANIEDGVKSFTVHQDAKAMNGEAVVICKNKTVAQMMITHFEGLRCGQNITARYLDGAEEPIPEPPVNTNAMPAKKDTWRASRYSTVGNDVVRKRRANSEAEPVKKDGSEQAPSPAGSPSFKHVPSALTRTSLKQCWADMNDDSDDDSDETQSTNAGPVRSFSDAMESSSNPEEI